MVHSPLRRRVLSALAASAAVCAAWYWTALAAGDPVPVRFGTPVMFDTGEAQPADVERADLNNDGIQDLAVVTTQGGGKIQILLGDGNGGLNKDNTIVVPYASGVASGDINADGILDLAVTQTSNKIASDGFCGLKSGTVVMLGTGGATPGFAFKTCVEPIQGRYLTDALIDDFNSDGKADLVSVDDNFYGATLYRGNGDGTFVVPGIRAIDGSGLHVFGPLSAMDINRDGQLDVIASVSGIGTFFGDGAGGLTFSSIGAGSTQLYQHLGVKSFAVGDINRDGIADIVGVERGTLPATPSTPQNFFFASLGAGDGITYISSDTHALADAAVGSVVLADFNKDTALDAVAVDQSGNSVRVYLGQATGVFADGPIVSVGVQPQFATSADWNGDNWRDLAVVDRNQGNQSRTWVLQQIPGSADSTPPSVAVTAPVAGSSLQGTVTVSATASDSSGVSRVEFYRDTVSIGADTTAPYSVSWNTAAGPNGAGTITARAYDLVDNMGTSAGVQVTVANLDTTAPSVVLTSPVAGSWLSGVVSLSATATDANGVTRLDFFAGTTLVGSDMTAPAPSGITWNSASVSPGSYAMTAKAYDAAGNVDTSAPVQVTIDQLPTAVAGAPQSVEATSAAGATITLAGTGTDPDVGDVLSFRWSGEGIALGTTASLTLTRPIGIYAFVLRVTDKVDGFAEDFVQVAIDDTTPPALALPASQTVSATSSSGAVVSYQGTATDLVSGPVPAACAPASGSLFPIGTTTVSCSATDGLANSATGSFTVTVTVTDGTGPTLALPAAISLVASGTSAVASFIASALDAVDGARPVVCTPASGSSFPIGVTTVSCTSSDASGNASTGSFTVTVTDGTGPTLALPAAISLVASGTSAVASFTASALDAVDGARPVVCTPASGSSLALGVSTVTCSSSDASGNTSTGSFTVTVTSTVLDNRPPVLRLPEDITVDTTGSSAIVTFTATATDALSGSVPVTCVPASGSSFPVDETKVSCSATDAAGNKAKGIFTVKVRRR